MNKPHTFGTSDLSLSTALFCENHNLEYINTTLWKWYFVFTETAELKKAVKEFYDGMLRVDPLEYFNTLKMFKTRLHNN